MVSKPSNNADFHRVRLRVSHAHPCLEMSKYAVLYM
jgi:hypothetical protein